MGQYSRISRGLLTFSVTWNSSSNGDFFIIPRLPFNRLQCIETSVKTTAKNENTAKYDVVFYRRNHYSIWYLLSINSSLCVIASYQFINFLHNTSPPVIFLTTRDLTKDGRLVSWIFYDEQMASCCDTPMFWYWLLVTRKFLFMKSRFSGHDCFSP